MQSVCLFQPTQAGFTMPKHRFTLENMNTSRLIRKKRIRSKNIPEQVKIYSTIF